MIEDQAVDFPNLPIIMAHPSFPWQDEAISLCLHKPNVYIDLSGWSPKYFSPTLIQYANSRLRTKVLFGSDYPLLLRIAGWQILPKFQSATMYGLSSLRRTLSSDCN